MRLVRIVFMFFFINPIPVGKFIACIRSKTCNRNIMKTRCLIVDDEPLARELIRGHILKLENFEIVDECDNAMKAMEALRNHHCRSDVSGY